MALCHYLEHLVGRLVESDGCQLDSFVEHGSGEVFEDQVVGASVWELVGAIGALVFGAVANRICN